MSGIVIKGITDASLASQSSDYSPIPAGNYPATIFNVVSETVKSGENAGKPRFNIQFRISEGTAENRRVFSYIPLYVAKDFWKTQSFFSSIGIDIKSGDFVVPEVNELLGKALTVRVKIGKDQNGADRNEVAGFDEVKDASSLLASIGATPVKDSPWAE
jgi:hypothetical protein